MMGGLRRDGEGGRKGGIKGKGRRQEGGGGRKVRDREWRWEGRE